MAGGQVRILKFFGPYMVCHIIKLGTQSVSSLIYTGQVLTISKRALVFTCLQYKSFENTAGNGQTAHSKHFLIFPHCFLPVWKTFCYLHQV